jgi:flagellar biogenesis protein FliO
METLLALLLIGGLAFVMMRFGRSGHAHNPPEKAAS